MVFGLLTWAPSTSEECPLASNPVEPDPWDDFSAVIHGTGSGAPVVVVRGEIDLVTAPELFDRMTEVLVYGPRTLTLDMTDVSFMGAAGVSAIVYARRAMPESCQLVILRPQRLIREVLEISGLDESCTISD
jgi:anti-sigma B factor antagonist